MIMSDISRLYDHIKLVLAVVVAAVIIVDVDPVVES